MIVKDSMRTVTYLLDVDEMNELYKRSQEFVFREAIIKFQAILTINNCHNQRLIVHAKLSPLKCPR